MFTDPQPLSPFKRHLYGGFGLALLVVAYLLIGVTGHAPWRGDDARHFGPVFDMLQGSSLLFPTIAGEPSTDYPPLYYWTAALFARALGWLMPLHDAARLATALFTGLSIFWISRAATRLYGRHTRTPAALLALGTLGLVLHAHETQPMVALMAMQSMTLAGLSLVPTRPALGWTQAGIGAAMSFLAAGPAGILLTLPLFFALILISPDCRNPRASGGLILGLTIALGASAIWPLVLHFQAPELLALWWREEWLIIGRDRFAGGEWPRFAELLGWFLWPLWPITLWSLWRGRRELSRISWFLPLAGGLLAALWIVLNGSLSPAAMLPLIPPLALFAAGGVPSLRRGAANAFDWFAVMTVAVFGLLIWIAWSAQAHFWPPGLARHLAKVSPGFALEGTALQATIGVTICIAWAALAYGLPRSLNRGPANWAIGMTMLWSLAVTLLMPWFDHDRSYQPAAQSLALTLAGERRDCVAGMDLTDSQRASLHYFAGVRTQRVAANETACGFLLVYDVRGTADRRPDAPWQQIWEFRRGGGRQLEIFRLYRRD